MKLDNDFDWLLSREEPIVPSSGFSDSVMSAVRTQAAEPPPIPFPWKRAIPGLLSACLVLVLFLAKASKARSQSSFPQSHFDLTPTLNVIIAELMPREIQSAVLVLLLTFVIAKLSIRLSLFR